MADLETLKEIEQLKGFCKEGGVRSTLLYAGEEIVKLRQRAECLKRGRDALLEAARVLVEALNAGGIGPLYDQTEALEKAIALAEGGEEAEKQKESELAMVLRRVKKVLNTEGNIATRDLLTELIEEQARKEKGEHR